MKDEEVIEVNDLKNLVSNAPTRSSSPYELLLRQNKKLGGFATKAFHDLKGILNHEITMPSRQRLVNNFALIPRQKTTKKLDNLAKIKRMVRKSHEVLASAHTVFPMTLFPARVVMDRTKITITKRDFILSSSVISIQIEDILNVSTSVGPLFGSLTIASRVMSSVDHFQINYFWRSDAIHLKHMIQGYVIAKQSKINTDQLSLNEMIETLRELGHDSSK